MENEEAAPPTPNDGSQAQRPIERDAKTERAGQTDGAVSQRQRAPAGRTPLFGR
jgi:hypothetical protein